MCCYIIKTPIGTNEFSRITADLVNSETIQTTSPLWTELCVFWNVYKPALLMSPYIFDYSRRCTARSTGITPSLKLSKPPILSGPNSLYSEMFVHPQHSCDCIFACPSWRYTARSCIVAFKRSVPACWLPRNPTIFHYFVKIEFFMAYIGCP